MMWSIASFNPRSVSGWIMGTFKLLRFVLKLHFEMDESFENFLERAGIFLVTRMIV
jgi:hypothetical protein